MNEVIIFNNPDGSCAVMTPVTDQLTIEQIAQKDVPPGVPYRIITSDQLPNDQYFFNAWTINFDLNTVNVDMTKARKVHLANIENTIQRAFIKNGVHIPMKLNLEEATTPEELKRMWPQEIIESAPL